jgi:hypothetical protein
MEKGKRTTYKQLPIYKRLHRKLKIEQHEPPHPKKKQKQNKKQNKNKVGVNADARKTIAVPAPILTSGMLLLNSTNII